MWPPCFSINARLSLVLVCVVPVMACAIGVLMTVCRKLFRDAAHPARIG